MTRELLARLKACKPALLGVLQDRASQDGQDRPVVAPALWCVVFLDMESRQTAAVSFR